jgi:DNA-binding MarR family transcriptional regulator
MSPGFLLWRATLAWQRRMRAALAPHGLTHVQFVLLASTWWLADQGQAPTQQGLAAHAGTDPMMTSQVLRRLEDRGLVTRQPDPEDARARRLGLSDAGRRLLAGALADVERADLDFFAPLADGLPGLVSSLSCLGRP